MVSFSLETQISLSKAIERDFDTQSKSCLPFFLPPGSFERLNAKISISSSWLAAAPASSRARASYCQRVERTMGVGERWATPSLKSSPSSSSVTLTSPTWNTLLFPIQKDVCNNTYALQAKFPRSAQRPNFLCSLA